MSDLPDGDLVDTGTEGPPPATELVPAEPEPRVPLHDRQTEARLSGYSWPEIGDHLDGRVSAAMAEGYSEREVLDYLGLPEPKVLQDRLGASWALSLADDPAAFAEPPTKPMAITPIEGMAAGRIAGHAGQAAPGTMMPTPGVTDLASSFNLHDAKMRGVYADALLAGEVKSPSDFAERYAGAFWGGLADQGVEIDGSMASSLVRAGRSLADTLPSNEDLTDTAIAIAHKAGMKLTPETVGVVKENLVDAWKETGADPMSLYGATDDMDLLARLTEPKLAGGTRRQGEVLSNMAQAFVEGNKQIWNAPENRLTKSLRELHELFSPSPIGGPITAGVRLVGEAATAVNKTLMGVVAGVISGGAQLAEEMLESRPELRDTPHRSGVVGAGAVDALMVTMAHIGLSGGLAGIRGTPQGQLGDPTSFLGRRPIETLRAVPEDFANRAASAAVEKTFTEAQAILDAPIKVVDPLRVGGEAVREVPAREAYVPDALVEAEVRDLAQLPETERSAAASAKVSLGPMEIRETAAGGTFEHWPIISAEGADVGNVQISRIGNIAHIDRMGVGEWFPGAGEKAMGIPNVVGARAVRQLARQYFEQNPEVETIEGFRMTGARGIVGGRDVSVTREQITGRAGTEPPYTQEQSFKVSAGHEPGEPAMPAVPGLAEGEPPIPGGMVRLYRVEPTREAVRIPDWLKESPEYQNTVQATGRWFTSDVAELDFYRRQFSEGHSVRYIDLPPAEAEAYRVSKTPLKPGGKGAPENPAAFSERPEREFFVPKETAQGSAKLEPAPAEIVARAEGHDAANAILAHFHNLMLDTAGGGTIEAWFRTADQKMKSAEYRGGLDFAQATIRQYRGQADRFIASNAAKLDDYRATVNKHVPEYEKLMADVKAAGPEYRQNLMAERLLHGEFVKEGGAPYDFRKEAGPSPTSLLDGNPLHEMLKFIEGRSLGATMDQASPLFPVAEMLRTVNENMRAQIQATIPDMRAFREDYYRHLWRNPDAGALDRVFGTGVQGSGKSLQRRSIPTIAEGIEAGLIPNILNPIDNTMHYISGMSYHLAAKKILESAEGSGYIKFADAPSDWVELNGMGATKAFAVEATPALKAAETRARNRLRAAIGKPEEAAARDDYRIAADAAKPAVMIQRASAPPGFATSYNYWVGKGFYGMPNAAPWYTKMQYFANSMTGMLLALPGYHFTAIVQEVAVNALANGLGALSRGQIATGLRGVGMGLTVAPEAVRQTLRGGWNGERGIYKRWLDLNDNSEAMTLFTDAGGRMGPRQDIYRFGEARSMFKSLAEGSLKQEIVRDFKDTLGTAEEAPAMRFGPLLAGRLVGLAGKEIGRVFNTMSDPMFDHMIPAVKGAVTFDALESWLKANPTASLEAKRAAARRIINSVDDRLGEMNQANLFWPTGIKQALNLVTVSLGWEYGSLRAAGIAGNRGDNTRRDQLQGRLTMDRMRWLVALPMVDGIMGSAYQFLKTGTLPDSFLQAQFPGIGRGQHATLPGYLGKDFAQWAKIGQSFSREGVIEGLHATGDWIGHHGNPLKAALWDFLSGQDAIGNKIRGMPQQALHYPFNTDSIYFHLPREWAQYMSNLWGHMLPIFVQGLANAKAGTNLNWVDRAFGFREAPTWVEDIRNGTDKFWGGREKGYLRDQQDQARRYNRENEALANPGPAAVVPPNPGAGGGAGRPRAPERAARPDSFAPDTRGGGRPDRNQRPDRF